jgi:hypothetical protein
VPSSRHLSDADAAALIRLGAMKTQHGVLRRIELDARGAVIVATLRDHDVERREISGRGPE